MKRKDVICRAAACIVLLLASVRLAAQPAAPAKEGETLTFTFAPASDLFTLRGNEAELARLSSLIDTYRSEITAGRMPIAVDGYCASQPSPAGNLRTAYLRANRVKSELITRKGLTEDAFVTANYATAYDDGRRDVVVVTLRIPAGEIAGQARNDRENAGEQPESPAEQPRQEIAAIEDDEPDIREEKPSRQEATPTTAAEPSVTLKPSTPAKPYCVAVRTNLVYDALLLPTLGVEWRINRHVGIKLDGSLSWWGNEQGKVQKMWLLNPEVRWYLLRDKRFYVGASGSYSKYNIYEFPLGKMLADDTGYQGKLWNAGVTVGYQLHLSRSFSVDFNLGLGYTRSEYDSFTMVDKVRVYKDRDRTKNFWGPTQAGISLVWTIGGKE